VILLESGIEADVLRAALGDNTFEINGLCVADLGECRKKNCGGEGAYFFLT